MSRKWTKKKIYVVSIAVIILALVGGGVFIYSANEAKLPKDDGYFLNKYKGIENHDACMDEFYQKGKTGPRLIGIPCPGEPQ